MIKSVLERFGLDSKEIAVYLQLIQHRSLRPSVLAKRLKLPRTTVQNILLRLCRANFVMEVKDGAVLSYSAEHPENLLVRLERERNQTVAGLQKTEDELRTVLPQLLAMMDSAKSLPQVRFFRGPEGAREVLRDTLKSTTELKDFANIDAMFEVIKDINDAYVAEREKTSVTKRSLLLDTAFARKVYHSGAYSPKSHRGYKWIPRGPYPFTIEMNIYSGKVSYLTYVKEELIGVIIENDYIYEMHDSMWNLLWDLLPAPDAKRKR